MPGTAETLEWLLHRIDSAAQQQRRLAGRRTAAEAAALIGG